MATNYPSSLDSYTDKISHITTILAKDVNDLQDAIIAIETQMGISGSLNFLTEVLKDLTPKLGGALDGMGFGINNVLDPVLDQDVSTKKFVLDNSINSIVEDLNPQLSKALDAQGFAINSVLDPVLAQDVSTKNYIDTYNHNSLQNLNAGDYKHLTAAQLTNNAYFNISQTWSEDQDLGLKRLILNNSSLFNLDKDLHIGGETLKIGENKTGTPVDLNDYTASIGNAGNNIPIFKLESTNFVNFNDTGGEAKWYATATNLEFNHNINIPYMENANGEAPYINLLGGNNTDFWSVGLSFWDYTKAENKWVAFLYNNAAWGYGIPEGLLTQIGTAAPNWTILTAGGEVTFKKSDFPWDGGAGTNLLKITDTGLLSSDNIKWSLGDSSDISHYWNGTDYKIDALTASTKIILGANIDEFNTAYADFSFSGTKFYIKPATALYLNLAGTNYLRLFSGYTLVSKNLQFNDNIKSIFGTENDASILYDGTDLIIDTDAVGTGSFKVNGHEIRANGTIKPVQLADASAANDSLYYSTTASKLAYKDSGGTVHALY